MTCNMSVFLWKTLMDKSIYTERYAIFLRLLRDARESQQITQTALAVRLREPQSLISKSELGQRRVDIVELLGWCDALGVSFVDFARQLESDIAELGQV